MIDPARIWAALVMVGISFAVLTPLNPDWRGRNNDSFPLSWFPMFARERPTLERPTYVIAVGAGAARQKLDVQWWTHGGFNQGRNMLTELVDQGPEALGPFCDRMARKVARRTGDDWEGLTEVRIVVGLYDRRRFFQEGDRTPLRERTLYACAVPR